MLLECGGYKMNKNINIAIEWRDAAKSTSVNAKEHIPNHIQNALTAIAIKKCVDEFEKGVSHGVIKLTAPNENGSDTLYVGQWLITVRDYTQIIPLDKFESGDFSAYLPSLSLVNALGESIFIDLIIPMRHEDTNASLAKMQAQISLKLFGSESALEDMTVGFSKHYYGRDLSAVSVSAKLNREFVREVFQEKVFFNKPFSSVVPIGAGQK